MKLMKCDPDREKHSKIVYSGGGFEYEFIADFADDYSDEANEISEAVLGF